MVDWTAAVTFDSPFRHTVIDGLLDATALDRINAEWPSEAWLKEDGKAQRKWSTTRLPPSARAVVDELPIRKIEELTGISGLQSDPDLFGAGLHCIPAGGFLKMHVDFNRHPRGWHRRVNALIYLNRKWRDKWGGELELGLEQRKRIAPIGGRCIIFETNDQTWHGHPNPLTCPRNVQRRSLALYFYTNEPPAEPAHTTIYRKKA
jgi:hypothetical protein